MFTNLDAQYLAELADAYTEAEINGTGLPRIDNAIASRLRRIAENIQGLDERSGVDQYDLGFLAGAAHQRSKSNILAEDEPLSKRKQSAKLAEATKGLKPSNIPDIDLDLEEFDL